MSCRFCLLALPLFAMLPATLACTPPGTVDPRLDDEERPAFVAALLDAHNRVRAEAEPTPTPPLPALAWSDSLAATAQDWADRCVFEHSTHSFGENLAIFSRLDVEPEAVVALWAAEVADYDHAANSCRAGRACGHYTQLVWRDTSEVGCGVALCPSVDGFGEGALWVCNYDPPGNFVGEQPY